MAPHVVVSGDGALAPTTSELLNNLESRLRAAKIHKDLDDARDYLVANVIAVGNAFNLTVYFRKARFLDPFSKHDFVRIEHTVKTWETGMLGTGGSGSGRVLSEVSKYVDEFLVGYLRVNSDEACKEYRLAEQKHRQELEAEQEAWRSSEDYSEIFDEIEEEFGVLE